MTLSFKDAPEGTKRGSERPKEGTQPGVIAQLVNEGKKVKEWPGKAPEEFTSLFIIIQLRQTSSDPERLGKRLNTRLYFAYKKYDRERQGGKGRDAKMVEVLKTLYGSGYYALAEKTPDLADLFVNVPVWVNIKHTGDNSWSTAITPWGKEDGGEYTPGFLTVSEDYVPWEVRDEDAGADNNAPNEGDGIPF